MCEKRFVKDHSYLVTYDKYCILDKVQHKHLYLDEVCEKLNEQQARIEMLEKGIMDCLFNNKSVGMLAEEMRLVE